MHNSVFEGCFFYFPVQTIFFAELYPSETRKLVGRLVNYVIYKVYILHKLVVHNIVFGISFQPCFLFYFLIGEKRTNALIKNKSPHLEVFHPNHVSTWNLLGIFALEATWRKILTSGNVQKRGWAMANRCYLCGKGEESCDHILIFCDVTSD